ncbi:MAG TPA: xylulokinase [Thermomicrobiales bacterium]|nr:xylulokinase [Thermomicrobiales bacterium]
MVRQAVVLGVDSSTQSTKVLAVDAATGETAGEGRAPHTGLDVQNPVEWWAALRDALRVAVTPAMAVAGIAVAGQQHGLVTLDAAGHVVRPAPLWNNTDAAPDAERLNAEADFAAAVGTRLVASVTIAKLAHLARTDPDDLARTAAVCLPHDYLTYRLTGRLVTDRGDASGSGWWSPREGRERRDLLALAVGPETAQRLKLPEVLGPEATAGRLTAEAAAELGLPASIPVGPGTGDNMAAALGVGATMGEIVVSLGTSGVAFAVTGLSTADETGEVCGFADAAGRFLPLACMLNCTRVVDTVAAMLGIDRLAALDRAAATAPGAHGLLLMPYFGGERTPNLPAATGSLAGMTATNLTPDLLLRAAVDGVAAGIAYCLEALARLGIEAPTLTLVGGGSQHAAWRQAIADATGLPAQIRAGGEHAARGAAMQAAAVALGKPLLEIVQDWRPPVVADATPRPGVRPAFALDTRRRIIAEERAQQAG